MGCIISQQQNDSSIRCNVVDLLALKLPSDIVNIITVYRGNMDNVAWYTNSAVALLHCKYGSDPKVTSGICCTCNDSIDTEFFKRWKQQYNNSHVVIFPQNFYLLNLISTIYIRKNTVIYFSPEFNLYIKQEDILVQQRLRNVDYTHSLRPRVRIIKHKCPSSMFHDGSLLSRWRNSAGEYDELCCSIVFESGRKVKACSNIAVCGTPVCLENKPVGIYVIPTCRGHAKSFGMLYSIHSRIKPCPCICNLN